MSDVYRDHVADKAKYKKSDAYLVENRTKCPDGRLRCLDCDTPLDSFCHSRPLGCGADDHLRIKIVELEKFNKPLSELTIQELQHKIGELQARLAFLVLGDPSTGATSGGNK